MAPFLCCTAAAYENQPEPSPSRFLRKTRTLTRIIVIALSLSFLGFFPVVQLAVRQLAKMEENM